MLTPRDIERIRSETQLEAMQNKKSVYTTNSEINFKTGLVIIHDSIKIFKITDVREGMTGTTVTAECINSYINAIYSETICRKDF
jgi:hypothetical protein